MTFSPYRTFPNIKFPYSTLLKNAFNLSLFGCSKNSFGSFSSMKLSAMDNIQNEQFKITVNILSRNLRADCLKVAVFKRVLRDGKWVNDTADRRLAGEIENAILTQARKLYRRDLAAREE